MRRALCLAAFCLTALVPFNVPAAVQPPGGMGAHGAAVHPEHVRTVESIVAAMYDTISGPKGQARDWDRYRALFFPGARLSVARAAHGTAVVDSVPVEEYVERERRYLEGSGYFEKSASMRIERFGQIAHVLSVYESRRAAQEEQPYARGVNSIQLVESAGRWWIVSVLWQRETEQFPIPEEFLKP